MSTTGSRKATAPRTYSLLKSNQLAKNWRVGLILGEGLIKTSRQELDVQADYHTEYYFTYFFYPPSAAGLSICQRDGTVVMTSADR